MAKSAAPDHGAHVDAWLVSRIRPQQCPEVRPEANRRAAVYLRVSTTRQPASMVLQRQELARCAEEKGYHIVSVYEDVGRSGLTLEGRPGLSQLLFDVVDGRTDFAFLLVLDVSRWGRFQDPDEAAHYEFVCRAHGVSVVYCREKLGQGASGHLVKQVKRVMAADHIRQISDRTRRGKRWAAEAGRAPGAWPRYLVARQVVERDGQPGSVLACGHFRFHPDQSLRLVPASRERSEVVRRIFRMFLDGGRSMADIASTLSDEGTVWTDGTKWTRRRISRVLRDPLSKGVQQYGRTRTVLGKRDRETDKSLWGEVKVFEGVVTSEAFEQVQARFRALGGKGAYTNEEMIAGLRALLKREGRISAALIDACPDIASARRYINRFGTLAAAAQLAGYERPQRGIGADGHPLTADAILEGLRRLETEEGKVNLARIQADRRLPSVAVIRKTFGTVTAACLRADV